MARLLFALAAALLLPGATLANPLTGDGAVPALYATRAEAEQAAKRFHCTGAHPMGQQWMPCAEHQAHPSH